MMSRMMAGLMFGGAGQDNTRGCPTLQQSMRLAEVLMTDLTRLKQTCVEQEAVSAKAQQFAAEQQLKAKQYKAQVISLVAASVMQRDELRQTKLKLRVAQQAHRSQASEFTAVCKSLAAHKAYVAELKAALRTTESERDSMGQLAALHEEDYEEARTRWLQACDHLTSCRQQLEEMTERCEAAEAAKKAAEEAQRQAEQALAELVNSRPETTATSDTATSSSKLAALATELSAALTAAHEQYAGCLDSLSLIAATAQQATGQAARAQTQQQTKAAVGVTASLLQELTQQLQAESDALQQVAMPHCCGLLSATHAAVAASQQQMDVLAVPSSLSAVQTASSSSLSSCESTELVLQPATPAVCSLDGEDTPSGLSSTSGSLFEVGDGFPEDADDDDVCSICSESVAVVDEADDSDVSSSSAKLQQQDQQQQPAQIVLYRTTCYQDHFIVGRVNAVKLILAMMKVDYEEVDVWLQPEYLADMKAGMADCDMEVVYPQVHVNGKFVGGAEEVDNFRAYGILPRILQGVSVQQAMEDLEAADYEEWLQYEEAKALANADPAVSN